METLNGRLEGILNPASFGGRERAQLTSEADTPRAREVLPVKLLELVASLHRELDADRRALLLERRTRQDRFDRGELPHYLPDHPARHGDWQVAPIPDDLMVRRVEITGPANNTKMVIQMLNGTSDGRADLAMLDLEDSMKPTWRNVIDGFHNIIGAARRDLAFVQPATDDQPSRTYRLSSSGLAHPMVRVRGLHLQEPHVLVGAEAVSAGLFDLAVCAFQTADILIRADQTPKFYVPKCESHLEARWWNRLFAAIERELELPPGTLRVTFLIETLPAAFEMEEILFEARSRVCGLNVGRWDKIFSDIKVLRNHPDRILADRASIDMKRPWMRNYAELLIKTCHLHGAFAMGGMAAFTPGKTEEIRKTQTEKVREDKTREASMGHDGCWVSHPYFIRTAMEQFTRPNQLDVQLDDSPSHPDLLPEASGPKTLEGLRTNVRVGIAYMRAWLAGLGCVAFDNLMEDLATLEISRAQVWQWLRHSVRLDDGSHVTPGLLERLFDEELEKILSETAGEQASEETRLATLHAAQEAWILFAKPALADSLHECLASLAVSQFTPKERRSHGNSLAAAEPELAH
jgi:malate synthase